MKAALYTLASLWLWFATTLANSPRLSCNHAEDVLDTLHGHVIVDTYRWLEDKESPRTKAWIRCQNERTTKVLNSLPNRSLIKQRLSELYRTDRTTIPRQANGRLFYLKKAANEERSSIAMREGVSGVERVLISPDTLSGIGSVSVDIVDVSQDGKLLAYSIRERGEDESVIRFLDVVESRLLPDVLARGRYYGGLAILPKEQGVIFSRMEESGPKVYYRRLGSSGADSLIFGTGYGKDKFVSVTFSSFGRHVILTVHYGSASSQTEIWAIDTFRPDTITPIIKDIPARFIPVAAGTKLYLKTDWGAPHGRVMLVDLLRPGQEHWEEVVSEEEGVIESIALAGGKLCVRYLQGAVSAIKVFEPGGTFIREVVFPALGNVGNVAGTYVSDTAFFSFQSFAIPCTVYKLSVSSGDFSEWSSPELLIDRDEFVTKQVWYASKDGTEVPMFIAHKKGVVLNGSNACLLTGYGGFNLSSQPSFNPSAVVFMEQGGIYAVANIRGGGEFGEDWHRAGMGAQKQNTFDDFIAAAEWLIDKQYTNSAKLAVTGRSNGGLLVGALLTQRPDLVKAVVCGYPLLDMVRYHKFLVASLWVPEYGSSDDSAQFHTLADYSPYNNVRAGTMYPSVLFMTGETDTRVDPLHARKMTALMQESTGSASPILLWYDGDTGHSGGTSINKTIDQTTDMLSFVFWQLEVRAGD